MKNIKLLDCTLREAPLENSLWGDFSIKKIIDGLVAANVDIIEVGFLKNDIHISGSSSFQKVEEMKPYIREKNNNTSYVALVDYGRYDLNFLSDYDGETIDAIRICFKHDEISGVIEYAEKIKEKGYAVCIQHVDTMWYKDNDIVDFIEKVNSLKPYSYSIVDTFGSMYGSDVEHFIDIVSSVLDDSIWLGFHAHNNLMLADANVQLFVNKCVGSRKIIVDSSLYGCGRSAGNAHTELLAHFLNNKLYAQYDINELLDLIDSVISLAQEKAKWGYSIPFFIAGMHNAHTFNVIQLLKRHNLKSKDLRGIIELLDENQRASYDYALLEQLYVKYFDNPIDDTEAICTLTKRFKNKNIVLLAPGKTVQESSDFITNYIRKNDAIVIGVNNIIENYRLDYIFFSGKKRYKDLQYLDYIKAGCPVAIVSSNIKNNADSNEIIVDYSSLIKFGWVNIDSSIILLLRLLLKCEVCNVSIAGLDGFYINDTNYYNQDLDTGLDNISKEELTNDIYSMINDICVNNSYFRINFLTKSIYSGAVKND